MFALLLAAATALPGARLQTPAPSALRLIAHGDTVTVFLVAAPPRGGGFVVYRGPVGGAMVKVTAEPVRAAASGAEAAGIIGADLLTVERDVQAPDAEGMYRRLRLDAFAGVVLSALYPKVGIALGRIYADTGLTRGARVAYRVVMTDAAGRETDRVLTGTVEVVDHPPPPPNDLKSEVADHAATVSW